MSSSFVLPVFRYHPDPVATGSVITSEAVCACCGQVRGFVYVGPVYAAEEITGRVCPWCIADGRVAGTFDAVLSDSSWRVPDDVPADVTDEVLLRTPGFIGWQQERWLHHCGDAAEFHGLLGASELVLLPDAVESLRAEAAEFGWTAGLTEEYLRALTKNGQPTAYLFRCRHCSTHLAYSDST